MNNEFIDELSKLCTKYQIEIVVGKNGLTAVYLQNAVIRYTSVRTDAYPILISKVTKG